MLQLLVMRHGKSDWDAPYDHDHDRPLAKRGTRAAGLMGRFVAQLEAVPDLVVTSTATRAATTARLAHGAGAWGCPVVETEVLYDASPLTVIVRAREVGDDVGRLMLVGHEPWCSGLISDLVGSAAVRFPTAAVARIDVAIERWGELDRGVGTLKWLVTPKVLGRVAGKGLGA